MSGLLLTGIGHLTTHDGDPITDAVVAIDETTITYAGSESDSPAQEGRELVDCEGRAVIPGFVDAHTHLVFAGDRSDEFARRLSGESYADIAASGGGILSTVSATRAASEDQLFDLGAARVWNMIRSGTTTLEIKSGYGLDLTTELRLLRVARRIGEELPVTVRTTFLGAHSVPVEFRSDRDGYIDLVTDEMIPAAAVLAVIHPRQRGIERAIMVVDDRAIEGIALDGVMRRFMGQRLRLGDPGQGLVDDRLAAFARGHDLGRVHIFLGEPALQGPMGNGVGLGASTPGWAGAWSSPPTR